MSSHKLNRVSAAGLLISLGIIYGDIGTSPLYVFKAIIDGRAINEVLVLGGISCVFWTLTLQTTLKYVIVTLQADNKGEGGIFSLFSLVRRKAKWLVVPAMIGGCALLADGIITPPITVTSAIEGLRLVPSLQHVPVVPVVLIIITLLFFIQQFGTNIVGKSFGPIMFLWFSMLGVLGVMQLITNPMVLKALNPYWAYKILFENPHGFIILGAVFLCTTGAEALYSDLGHCGKHNIRVSWTFVKTMLVLNYLGQGAWLLKEHMGTVVGENPFYGMMPDAFRLFGIALATAAAIVASQALISGSFTLISEAVRMNLWPKVRINYPTESKGQLYVPSVNWLLWAGCCFVVYHFGESSKMEAAYGLSITIAMLMTTVLMCVFLLTRKVALPIVIVFVGMYIVVEGAFLLGNLSKFMHGGYFTVILGSLIFSVMWTWFKARKIKNRYVKFVEIEDYFEILEDLSKDSTVSKYSSQLVYLTSANFDSEIESKIIYSILQKQPKRADVYWLVHVDVLDEPYKKEYRVVEMVPGVLYRVDFRLGFRESQRINILFRKVVEEMVKNKEVSITSQYQSLRKHNLVGDFRFVVLEKILSDPRALSFIERMTMYYYFVLKKLSLSEEKGFGLDLSSVAVEKVPLVLTTTDNVEIKRVDFEGGNGVDALYNPKAAKHSEV
ncbi:KUP/HAK/KT family potassium transporter [Solitalea canadensis]|uniref:Probable potassium transport system protein Kup n=1 Tax=Solitalea canadensis (strain ATCC 29591 / DSM 3403 / JCM 21819 / LMG 8368 / NBRC 15130 / NCIMB 12057 / USAM 9D) TaxID=929556 RepID=H8KXZ9_SOLCM|nr:KUP/HAK/KT family potassium transporter [Solitalea canadensis]AFD05675.1 K+ transporter [Solitalea canadensis DSM 3403]